MRIIFLAAILAFAACDREAATNKHANTKKPTDAPAPSPDSPSGTAPAAELPITKAESSRLYVAQSNAPAGDVAARAQAVNTFGLNLYRQLVKTQPQGNILTSPLSVAAAFALLYPGTAGTTQTDIGTTFGFDPPSAPFHDAMKGLLLKLQAAGNQATASQKFQLSIANDVWGGTAKTLQPDYLDTVKTYYNAGVNLLDFAKDAEAARATINAQVAKETGDHIKDLLPSGSVSSTTDLVLTNAIYLLADWETPFPKTGTHPGDFTKGDGTKTTVSYMSQSSHLAYFETQSYQAVSLPYAGHKLAMLVLLPTQSAALGQVETSLSAADLKTVLAGLTSAEVNLTLPKFEFSWGSSLKAALIDSGLKKGAFGDDAASLADFSALFVGAKPGDDKISDVVQKTYIKVDEKGTEAAAATGIMVGATDAAFNPTPPKTVLVNRPALFFLYEADTKAVLFLGRLAEPAAN